MLLLFPQLIIGTVDLLAAFLLLYGLHRMSSPVTAPSGIFVAGIGMAAVVLVSFLDIFGISAAAKPLLLVNIALALIAIAVGGGIAWWSGKKVAMTAMPQMVAIYNGMGGGAAGAIAAVELFSRHENGPTEILVTLFGALIGAVSFSGSLIAWAKLQGILNNPLRFTGQKIFNAAVFAVTLGFGGAIIVLDRTGVAPPGLIYIFFGCALVFGILMTLPIGGADMPVVVCAAKPCIDDRRHGCGRRRPDAHIADGQGDEPFGQQCPVFKFWRGAET